MTADFCLALLSSIYHSRCRPLPRPNPHLPPSLPRTHSQTLAWMPRRSTLQTLMQKGEDRSGWVPRRRPSRCLRFTVPCVRLLFRLLSESVAEVSTLLSIDSPRRVERQFSSLTSSADVLAAAEDFFPFLTVSHSQDATIGPLLLRMQSHYNVRGHHLFPRVQPILNHLPSRQLTYTVVSLVRLLHLFL